MPNVLPSLDKLISDLAERRDPGLNDLHELVYGIALHVEKLTTERDGLIGGTVVLNRKPVRSEICASQSASRLTSAELAADMNDLFLSPTIEEISNYKKLIADLRDELRVSRAEIGLLRGDPSKITSKEQS